MWLALAAGALIFSLVEQSPAQVGATVDRVTGNISLSQSGGASELKGYTISSATGLLSPSGWSSLEDQGTSGWSEANPREQQLSELNLNESTALSDGASWDLGAAYGGAVAPRDEDVSFEYWTADGSVQTGTVDYAGPANDLVLNIDPATGAATLQNLSASVGDFDITAYNIHSESGSLVVDNFTGIGEDGWVNANPKTTSLAELNLDGSKVFSEGVVVALGNIFDPSGTQDLTLEFGDAALELRPGTVEYGAGGTVTPPPSSLMCDLDGDGTVAFGDFLILSGNFGQAGTQADGDCGDMDGEVGFADFLALSAEFGQSAGAQAVPEPASAVLVLSGLFALAMFRKRTTQFCVMLLAVGLLASTSQQTWAVDFDSRFIRLDPAGTNGQINTTVEAREIIAAVPVDAEDGAAVGDYIIAEHVVGTLDIIDLAGGGGTFGINNPYLNGVNDGSMDDFLQYVSGTLVIPEGEWAIGFGSDDGGFINMPSISFVDTFNENGPAVEGDGEIIFNAPRGHAWTGGNFVVPEGGITTAFEAGFYERGGGDSFEVAVVDEFVGVFEGSTVAQDFADLGLELEDGNFDWVVTGDPFDPFLGNTGDFNLDGTVDLADWGILVANFGTGASLTQGDINFDGLVNLQDASEFHAAFTAGGEVSAIPEPATASLLLMGIGLLLGKHRRRRVA